MIAFFCCWGGSDRAAIAITTALSPESRMLATMIAPKAPQTAPDVSASMTSDAAETRCSHQRLHESAHLRRVPRHGEAALFHHGQLGVGRVAADADRARLAEADVGELRDRLVGERAGAADDADPALFVDVARHDADLDL